MFGGNERERPDKPYPDAQYGQPPPQYGGAPQYGPGGGVNPGGIQLVPADTRVMIQQTPAQVIMTQAEPFQMLPMVLSVISVFCCQCLGFPAMVISLMSYTDHSVNNMPYYKSKKSTACGLAVAGIVIGGVSFTGIFIWWIVVATRCVGYYC